MHHKQECDWKKERERLFAQPHFPVLRQEAAAYRCCSKSLNLLWCQNILGLGTTYDQLTVQTWLVNDLPPNNSFVEFP